MVCPSINEGIEMTDMHKVINDVETKFGSIDPFIQKLKQIVIIITDNEDDDCEIGRLVRELLE